MSEIELLIEIKNILGFIMLLQFFLFLKSIFGIVSGFISSFLD